MEERRGDLHAAAQGAGPVKCVAGLLVALMADLAFAGCPIKDNTGQRLSSGPIVLAWRAEPKDIVVGRPFVVRLELCFDALVAGELHTLRQSVTLQ